MHFMLDAMLLADAAGPVNLVMDLDHQAGAKVGGAGSVAHLVCVYACTHNTWTHIANSTACFTTQRIHAYYTE